MLDLVMVAFDNCSCWGGGELLLGGRVGFDLVKQEVKKELRRLAFCGGLDARESWKVKLLLYLGFVRVTRSHGGGDF